MKIYRYLSQNELDLILENDISKIGCEYSHNEDFKRINNHKYKTNVKYLHFFKDSKDCNRVKFISDGNDSNFYFAEFNVPFTTLIRYYGYGKYDMKKYPYGIEKVLEFAIPTSKFKSKYLCSYVLDEEHQHSVEENRRLNEMFKKCKDVFKYSKLPELKNDKKESISDTNEEITLKF